MGRPIKQKWLNPQLIGYGQGAGAGVVSNSSVGGNAVSVTNGNINIATITRGSGYSAGTVTATISAPTLDDGTTATVSTVYLFANGAIKAIGVNNAGRGYLSNPTVTFFGANTGAATATVSLAAGTGITAAIQGNAWFKGTSSGDYYADFIKQRGSHSFVMANAAGPNQVRQTLRMESTNKTGTGGDYSGLGPTAAGNVTICAQFADGHTFQIKKITDRVVHSNTGQVYKWTFGTAANVSASNITVQIDSV